MAARQPARASPELRKAPLSPRYPRNYTTPWGTINPSAKIVDELGELLDKDDRLRVLVQPLATQPPATVDPQAEADEAFDDLQYDRAFVFYAALALSKKNLGRLLTCVKFIDTNDVRDKMLAIISDADPSLVASLTPAMQGRLAALITPAIGTGLASDRASEAMTSDQTVAAQPRGPNGWTAWAEQLVRAEDLPSAERVVQDAVTNWDTKSFRTSEATSRAFANNLGNLNGDAASLARRSVPHIFASIFPSDEVPDKNTKPVAEVLFALGLGHGFLRQFGALFLSGRGVEHGQEYQRDIWRDGGHGPDGARP